MKLDAVYRERAVPDAHDRAVVGPGCHLQRLRQRFGDHQRVITAGDERLLKAPEDAFPIMVNGRCLAMHQLRRANNLAAERDANTLMSEADTKDGGRRPESAD